MESEPVIRDIAIVGIGCRFAGARDTRGYWSLVHDGKDSFTDIPADRWDASLYHTENRRDPDGSYAPKGAFIEDIRSFPALALGIPPRRVEVMDPQHRFAIEVSLEAIEDAGHRPAELPRKTGVFIGVTAYEFRVLQATRIMTKLMASGYFGRAPEDTAPFAEAVERMVQPRPYTASGILGNMTAACVAQELDLHGPAYSVDSACASGMVAILDAVTKLRAGAIDCALAGGVYLCLTPEHYVGFSRLGAISGSGRCLPFDERADGFVQGDGAAVVVLKRVEDAVRDGDRIYAVIKGIGGNNDGKGDGPMAPVREGQAEAISIAWEDAGVSPDAVGYLEAHGTGTTVGDVVEFKALTDVFGTQTAAALGSAKGNVGHTMAAAGVAGLVKAALAIHHRTIPPMAGFRSAKPALELDETAFRIPSTPETWTDEERLAGVSSFGFGGTNTHAVLGQAPDTPAETTDQAEVVLMSAPDLASLRDLAGRTADAVEADPGMTVASVARAWLPRRKQSARVGFVAASRQELIDGLRAVASGERVKGVHVAECEGAPAIAFMYPGQGSQRLGMLAGIRERFGIVAAALDRLEAELDGELDAPLTHLIYPERRQQPIDEETAAAQLTATENCQPALLACGVALTELLGQVGVTPAVVTGHSLGEFTAAAAAGVLPAADAARFVSRRGRRMAELPGEHGAMAAIMTDHAEAEKLLVDGVVVANRNHPRQLVVSGCQAGITEVLARAEAADVRAVALQVSHGFHSPVLADLDVADLVDDLPLSDPAVTVASGISSTPYADASDARAVFKRHAVSPVDFQGALEQCRGAGAELYLQVGAGGPLASFARGSLPRGSRRAVLPLASMEDDDGGRSLLDTLAQLFTRGVDVDATSVTGQATVASLPAAVLPREPYWPIKDRKQRTLKIRGQAPPPRQETATEPTPPVEPPPQQAEVPSSSADPIVDKVLGVVARVSAYPLDSLGPDLALVQDLGFDSLMVGDLATGLAEAFPGMAGIPQELLIGRPTVADIIDHVKGAGRSEVSADDDATPLRPSTVHWVATPLPALPEREPTPGPVLVVAASGPIGQNVAAALPGATLLTPEQAIEAQPAAAIFWCARDEDPAPVGTVLAGERPVPDPAAALLATLRTQAASGAHPDVIAVVDSNDPWAGGILGAIRALGREWPDSRCKTVAIDHDVPMFAGASRIIEEWRTADASADVLLTADARFVAGLTDASSDPQWDGTGTVVITGGTRGIGAKLALRLAGDATPVVVVGRGDPDASLAEALASGTVRHIRADVTHRDGIRAALAPVGPIAALVHSAGVLADGDVGHVDLARGTVARAVKVDGWLNTIAAAGSDLQVTLAIGSWAGRFGNRHQVHYAAANAAIAAIAPHLPTRACVTEFGPWTSSDMVQTIPAPVRQAMRAEGVDFVADEAGLDAIIAALKGQHGAVVLGRRLPASSRAIAYETTLSTDTHPFLADHAIAGVPVLPMAGALDLLAWGAGTDVELSDLTLYQGVTVRQPLRVQVVVQGSRAELRIGDQGTLAYRAHVGPKTPYEDPGPAEGGEASSLSIEEFYGGITFHGPLLQGIVSIDGVGEEFVRGVVRTSRPSALIPGTTRQGWAVDPLALDSAFQLSAMVAWMRFGRAGTPVGLGRYRQLAPLPDTEILAEVAIGPRDGDRFTGTVRLRDASGALLAVAEDVVAELRKTADDDAFEVKPEWVDPATWPGVQDLEMRLAMAKATGIDNPYFSVHEGTARNVTVVKGRELVNFSSYNYLGLSGDSRVLADTRDAIDRYGTSVSASRVASGERPFHGDLESALATCQRAEDALVFTAGHATNVTTIGHLLGPKDLVLHDELIHDSALQGIKLSGAARRGFRHDEPAHLEAQLQALRKHHEKVLIVVEGVYSMDGDICALPAYVELKKRFGCLLMVDEAHSFGVIGATGCGAAEHYDLAPGDVDIWMGTLSKSLASCGGWIAGSRTLVNYLRYTAPGFVYSAGITPANGVAALSALRLMLAEPDRVQKLQANARVFHEALVARNLDTGPALGGSAVIPVVTGNSMHAMLLSQHLLAKGINVQPIVYPAVADDAARLRFFLSSTHTTEQLQWTAETVAETLAGVRADHPA